MTIKEQGLAARTVAEEATIVLYYIPGTFEAEVVYAKEGYGYDQLRVANAVARMYDRMNNGLNLVVISVCKPAN
ncbi:MAG: hypothetical protein Q7S31_01440 [bacterium]|nr:hypothetical protein [bacterium]